MTTARYVRVHKITLAAGQGDVISAQGRYVACLMSSDVFNLSYGEGPVVRFEAGFKIRLSDDEDPFEKIRVANPGASSIDIELIIGSGDFEDARVVLPSGGLKMDVGDTLTSGADVSVAATSNAVVLAANSARHYAVIQNLDATATIHYGDASSGAAEGIRLGPGERERIETTAAIRVFNPTGSAVAVAVLEVSD